MGLDAIDTNILKMIGEIKNKCMCVDRNISKFVGGQIVFQLLYPCSVFYLKY